MPKKALPKSSTPVLATKHKDKRANIPTEELRDFVADEEKAPKTVLYPRDPSLDPQLVWKGKDEQDHQPLEVPAVPIYIQEKIKPQVIIEDLRATAKAGGKEHTPELFSDFNGIKFEQLIEFYQHKDGKAEDANRQPEQIRAFRDTWKLGIHSYLAYLRDRLTVARELLTESGSVFVQIGDENVHLARSILDEVFGSENYIALIAFKKPGQRSSDTLPMMTDFILWYAKGKGAIKFRPLLVPKSLSGDGGDHYNSVELSDGKVRQLTNEERFNPSSLPTGAKVFETTSATSAGAQSGDGKLEFAGKPHYPPAHKHWSASVTGMKTLASAGRLVPSGPSIRYKRYFDDFGFMYRDNRWDDAGLFGENTYVVQTSTTAVECCLLMTTDPGDLALDPTCGSGTTAFVAEQWGRRWITCDTSRFAIALARTRLMAGKFPYYLLADSDEGRRKEMELTGKFVPGSAPAPGAAVGTPPTASSARGVSDEGVGHDTRGACAQKFESDIKRGFIYKRVPHVTLKSIANNPDIKPGMSRAEIDAAIARHADTELLFDQPYEDNKRIRVTGPFTVESLSPHRFLSADGNGDGTVSEQEARQHHDFTTMILDNLRKSGVQNTRKEERLKFDRLEPFAGTWLHATGDYTDKDGKTRRAAVSIGPEHGTVGPDLVKEAAKEAVQGVGFDLLIVCGFAFDPHVSEEVKRYGKLAVVPARMNPDLAMGDELLKKTGAGNLFMVFGEPDVEIKPRKDGKLTVEIKGVDIYDPTTGQIRNSSTDDIACWFIDTDYNGESFFVRHAYFTGADEPYEKLKRALRADIDEAAWSSLYSTVSRLFDKPKTGKIAIKVINHYGDEVLKVYEP